MNPSVDITMHVWSHKMLLSMFAARSIFPGVPSPVGILPRCKLVICCGVGVRLSYMYWMTSILVSGTYRCTYNWQDNSSVAANVLMNNAGMTCLLRLWVDLRMITEQREYVYWKETTESTYMTVLMPTICWNSWRRHPTISARRTGATDNIFHSKQPDSTYETSGIHCSVVF